MGKAKKNRSAGRFDPLARPDKNKMEDDDMEVAEVKISSHRARHMERKRLQAEAVALKMQKGKISKADKLSYQREQRAISMQQKVTKAALHAASGHGLLEAAAAQAALVPEVQAPSAFGGFDLPTPAATSGESMFAGCVSGS